MRHVQSCLYRNRNRRINQSSTLLLFLRRFSASPLRGGPKRIKFVTSTSLVNHAWHSRASPFVSCSFAMRRKKTTQRTFSFWKNRETILLPRCRYTIGYRFYKEHGDLALRQGRKCAAKVLAPKEFLKFRKLFAGCFPKRILLKGPRHTSLRSAAAVGAPSNISLRRHKTL